MDGLKDWWKQLRLSTEEDNEIVVDEEVLLEKI